MRKGFYSVEAPKCVPLRTARTYYDGEMERCLASDAKLFVIRFQQDGRHYSTVKTVRGVLRLAFQMEVDDDVLLKNPFGFELAGGPMTACEGSRHKRPDVEVPKICS